MMIAIGRICYSLQRKFSVSNHARLFSLPKSMSAIRSLTSRMENQEPRPMVPQVIYIGTLTNVVKGIKIFSLSTSIMGIGMQTVLYDKLTSEAVSGMATYAACGFVFFFTFVTPLLLHFVTRKYVTRLEFEHESKVFTCETLTLLTRTRTHSFTAENVTVPDNPGIFTTFRANGFPMFVDPEQFRSKVVFIHLMGYDKPIDLLVTPKNARADKS